jgi:NADH-quinone oxidoreductase subunit C
MADPHRYQAIRDRFEATVAQLRTRVDANLFTTSTFRDNCRLIVPVDKANQVHSLLASLKAMGFDMLVELGAADYLHYPHATDRYGVWYCLLNTQSGERIIVKTFVNDPEPRLRSVFDLWQGADWMEREAYDLFGIEFEGHPDLRRILLPDEFTSFPLRKDYPLRGKGERHNFQPILRAES